MKSSGFNIIDRCTFGYNVLVVCLILLFHSRIPDWPLRLLPNVAMMAVVLLMVYALRERTAVVARLARYLYPTVLFAAMYSQTGTINHIVFPEFLDPLFQRMEAGLFGVQPAVMLAQWFPQLWLAEYLHFAYFSYYLLFVGLGAFLYLRRPPAQFFDYMFALCATMYTCYVIFILLPVIGARSFNLDDAPGNGPFTAVMNVIYRHGEIEGAAFPSSHVAIAAVVLYYAFRYARPSVWVLGPVIVSLMVATVYCRYHYAVDVLAGLALAAALIPLWRKINPHVREIT